MELDKNNVGELYRIAEEDEEEEVKKEDEEEEVKLEDGNVGNERHGEEDEEEKEVAKVIEEKGKEKEGKEDETAEEEDDNAHELLLWSIVSSTELLRRLLLGCEELEDKLRAKSALSDRLTEGIKNCEEEEERKKDRRENLAPNREDVTRAQLKEAEDRLACETNRGNALAAEIVDLERFDSLLKDAGPFAVLAVMGLATLLSPWWRRKEDERKERSFAVATLYGRLVRFYASVCYLRPVRATLMHVFAALIILGLGTLIPGLRAEG
jgi:hypothetical protein